MIALYIVSSLILLYFIILFIIFMVVFYAPHSDDLDIPKEIRNEKYKDVTIKLITDFQKIPYEEVWTKSYDHKKLCAKKYIVKDTKEWAICFHGYKGTGRRDFSGGSKGLFKLESNILLVDERAQGKSQGLSMTFGVKERFDVKTWVDYLIDNYGNDINISLYGVSMGAATVLMASSLELKNVKRIIADCPFTSPKDIIIKVMTKDLKLPMFPFYSFVYMSALIFGGFRLDAVDGKEEVKKSKIPILIIHGEEDKFVPPYMSEIDSENVSRYTFKNAPHGLSYLEDTERYNKILFDFIEKTK